jgi:hypothetical protein
LMDFPHLIRNPLHMNVNVNDSIVPAILWGWGKEF